MSDEKQYGLKDAHALKTPDDSVDLYRKWATSYDQTFAQDRGYNYPAHIAQVLHNLSEIDDSPILDVGAGTGLVAQEILANGRCVIDAIDISQEMLAQSMAKGIYRNYIQADLSQPLALDDDIYGVVVSAGTFTHGHVGPQALRELLRIAKPNALFCLGVNATAFDKYGFGSAFAALQAEGLISPLEFEKTNFYRYADDANRNDIGFTAVFRKI
ncbi:MAG: putative TPR repeat methyltransferase [Arenicella sp.]|jgi:predicted TPR repeat methyltransferase